MFFTVGKILKPHGLKGNLKIHLYEEERENKMLDCPFFIEGEEYRVESFGRIGSNSVVKFKSIDDRTAAEKLSGRFLQVSEENLLGLNENEYYVSDIVGSAIVGNDGSAIGRVKDVMKLPAGDVLDIELGDGKSATLLFRKEFFLEINLQEKRLVLRHRQEFYAF